MKIGNVKIHFFKPLPLERNQLEGYQILCVGNHLKKVILIFALIFILFGIIFFLYYWYGIGTSWVLAFKNYTCISLIYVIIGLVLEFIIVIPVHELSHAIPFNQSGDIYLSTFNKINRFIWIGDMKRCVFLRRLIQPCIIGFVLMIISIFMKFNICSSTLFFLGLICLIGAFKDLQKFITVLKNKDIKVLRISKNGEEIYYK